MIKKEFISTLLLMPSNWRITVTLPEQFKEFLELWAENEHRSVSNLAASILINAAQEKISMSQALKKSNPQTKAKANPAKPKQTT